MPSADTKYSSAWNEISARIQARELVWVAFVSLAVTLIGVAASKDCNRFIGVGVGFAALWTAMFSRHHDMIIHLLADFQKDVAAKAPDSTGAPDWLPRYSGEASLQRKWRDYAQMIATVGTAGSALWLAYPAVDWSLKSARTWVFLLSLACGLSAVAMVLTTHRARKKFAQEWIMRKNGSAGGADIAFYVSNR